ncbi:Plasmid stabilisation system protein [Bordetella ansorpii]|uniref:Plasmid stabilisation system protein n=1 Tax=Bordetella ansorpii TaxID=288768 RepID=A0A157MRH1_9BORD|nr:type II toxin-antitoxin system RelE/ParE family toxin [Bordetella ansorpii]SAI11346.1 Plasmid stabilisation system protein [Bordetella ansorpii]
MSYRVRFTRHAERDLQRLYDFIIDRDSSDGAVADRALAAIEDSLQILRISPFTCRRTTGGSPFLRELIIPFGNMGYLALFEIESPEIVTVLAVRHQREDDYYR